MTRDSSIRDAPPELGRSSTSRAEQIPGGALADLLGEDEPETALAERRDYGERYAFVRVLGEGGQGIVVCARDTLLERDVAIKALKKPLNPARQDYLAREARLCGILEHPNILPTYDLAYDETGSPLFVMKKIEGTLLEDMLQETHRKKHLGLDGRRQTEMSRLRLLQIFLQVCNAIEFAHSRGVLHLDIKPGNVKLGAFGEVYVIDWGFAARMDEEPTVLAGTPIYIAPERFTKRPPDARCDVYSLGVMLYRILTNRHPREVSRMTFKEYRRQYDEIPLVRPRERDRSIPVALEAIVLKAMADDPVGRYASVRELADDLNRFLDMLPVSAYRETIFHRASRYGRKHRRGVTVAAVLLAALAVTAGVAYRMHQAQRRAEGLAQRHRLEEERKRRLAKARIPLKKAVDLVQSVRQAVKAAPEKEGKLTLLAPAFRLFDQAIRLDIDRQYADAYYERGMAHALAHNWALALEDFEKAYTIDPTYIMARYYAGQIQADHFKNPERAKAEFEAMNRFDPGNEYSELGQARLELGAAERLKDAKGDAEAIAGHYRAALERCDRVEAVNPDLADVWYLRALVYQRSETLRDIDQALEAYTRYLQVRRDNPSAYANRADIYARELGNYEAAIRDYDEALRANPDYYLALRNRGYWLYKELDRSEEGLRDLNAAIAVKKDFWNYMTRGAIYEGMGRMRAAETDYTEAHRLEPENPYIWYRWGVFHFREGNAADAELSLTKSLELSPEADKAIRYHRRGIVRLAQAKYADAVNDFEASIRLRATGRIYPALMRWLALRLEGVPVDRASFEQNLDAPEDKPWLAAVGSVYLGDIPPAEALALAQTPAARCETFFYLGARALVEDRLVEARSYLGEALATGAELQMEHALARAMLAQVKEAEDSAAEITRIAPIKQ